MIHSMTGFGKTALEVSQETLFSFEISTVNRKQLELRFNMPRELMVLENDLRKIVTKSVSRGMLNIRLIPVDNSNSMLSDVKINQLMLNEIVKSALELKTAFSSENLSIDLASFYQIPGVINSAEVDCSDDALKHRVFDSLASAIENLMHSRKIEGEALKHDLENRKNLLVDILTRIEPFVSNIQQLLKEKLLAKLSEENLTVDANDDRLHKEILFYIDKSDVTEEIIRLKSHFSQFDKFLDDKFVNPGRNLDFLLQEMFREINTLGNKSHLVEVSPLVVEFKAELEKIREQVQNIE